jgi:hypothetical protein
MEGDPNCSIKIFAKCGPLSERMTVGLPKRPKCNTETQSQSMDKMIKMQSKLISISKQVLEDYVKQHNSVNSASVTEQYSSVLLRGSWTQSRISMYCSNGKQKTSFLITCTLTVVHLFEIWKSLQLMDKNYGYPSLKFHTLYSIQLTETKTERQGAFNRDFCPQKLPFLW